MTKRQGAFGPRSFLMLGVCLLALAGAAVAPALATRSQAPAAGSTTNDGRPLRLLFLGQDQRHHDSHALFPLLAAPLARMGIQMTHVDTPAEAFDPERLQYYDGIVIYANHTEITPEQEQALVDFVEGGKGLVALHSASFMFTDAPRYIPMVGGQFLRHGTGEFSAEIIAPDHPVMQGLEPFTTWDETYVHERHNTENRTVLMERVDAEGREPYTWVRTEGAGRVFYTAFGHDERTWSNPGFHRLVANGIAWVVSEEARSAYRKLRMPGVEYVEGFNVPNYEQRDPAPNYQLPFLPDEAEKFMTLAPEFELTRFAADPDIFKPISFNFDERGRMWVIETRDYPNRMLDGAPGNDRIRILEDTDADGKADKFTLFADDLNMPTSLVFARGGIIVSGAPNFLFLKDTDGDDQADVREVLSSGWGIRDTHAIASNLMYGHDNYIWGVVGYSGYDGTMNGRQMQFGQGMYRFRPDGSDFEYITGSTNNTWGLGLSESFDVFGGTANNDQSFHVAIPNRYFEGIEGIPNGTPNGRGVGPGYASIAQYYAVHPITPYIRQVDVFGGFTAGSGHQLYTARQFPREFWNRKALISEPTAHLLALGVLEEQGSGYVTRDGWNLIASAEEWFAPIHATVGPDGAVWFSDWYNFIIQHNPTPQGYSNGRGNAYETSLRDKERGRIYRIAYKGADPVTPRSLSIEDPAGLIDALSADNMFWRLHAQRLLVERGQTDVVPQLVALVRNTSVDELGLNGGALHALWTLHGLGAIDAPSGDGYAVAVEALKHPSAAVRKAAAMVLPHVPEAARAVLDAGLLADPDLHTRLAAVLVVADMPASVSEIGPALLAASREEVNYRDKWIGRALYIAANRHADSFLAARQADGGASVLPIGLRLPEDARPDWREPGADELAADWTAIKVPGPWEANGLADFDGAVWFTRTFDVTTTSAATLRLGPMRNSGEAWLNGQQLWSPMPQGRGGRGGRGGPPSPAPPGFSGRGNAVGEFVVPEGLLRSGSNVLTVRIQNGRNEGGFLAPEPDAMWLRAGSTNVALAGEWRYRVERQTNAGPLYDGPEQLAAHVAFTRGGGTRTASADVTGPLLDSAPAAPAAPPLSPADMERFNAGRELYATICIACHQADGRGGDQAASLVGSAVATGDPSAPVRVLLHGKQGEVGLMPPLGTSLSDEQIANVLTYVRREWGHTASPVTAAQVSAERAATADRDRPYTAAELQ